MSVSGRRLPPAARAIATAVTGAVAAAHSVDADGFAQSTADLAGLDREQVGLVLGAVVRSLLEDLHPDGLDSDDVRTLLERCTRSAVGWFPGLDPGVLLGLLAGALGISEPDGEARPLSAPEVSSHAPILVADLLGVARRPLAGYLDAAFADITRAETMEQP